MAVRGDIRAELKPTVERLPVSARTPWNGALFYGVQDVQDAEIVTTAGDGETDGKM